MSVPNGRLPFAVTGEGKVVSSLPWLVDLSVLPRQARRPPGSYTRSK